MGEPAVSISMSPFDYVRKGLPDPLTLRVSPRDITPRQWQELIDEEMFRIRGSLRDMLGFRRFEDIRKKEIEPLVGDAGNMYYSDLSPAYDCRMMGFATNKGRLLGDHTVILLIDRGGNWYMWYSVSREVYDRPGMPSKTAGHASVTMLDDTKMLELLRSEGHTLGLDILMWLDEMVNRTIADRQARLDAVKSLGHGQALSRIDHWA